MIWIMHLSTLFHESWFQGIYSEVALLGGRMGYWLIQSNFYWGMTFVYFLLTPFPWKHTGFKVNTECQLWFPGNNVYYKGGPWLWTILDWKDCEWTCRPWRLMWSWTNRKLVSLWGVSYNIIYSWWGLTSCSDNWLQVVARVEYKKNPHGRVGNTHPYGVVQLKMLRRIPWILKEDALDAVVQRCCCFLPSVLLQS